MTARASLAGVILCSLALAASASWHVHWMAPFFSGGGYCSEAVSFVQGLADTGVSLSIDQHGDAVSQEYLAGLPPSTFSLLQRLYSTPLPPSKPLVVVCHSEPGAWAPAQYHTSVCPLPAAAITIGRTMFETDRVPSGWPARLGSMGEVWVPTPFHADIFTTSGGLPPHRVRVVPEAVDTQRFDPGAVRPFPLPVPPGTFPFLSVFKWEHRKGWDTLLGAWWSEFHRGEGVSLVILTSAYHSSGDFAGAMQRLLRSRFDCQAVGQRAVGEVEGRGWASNLTHTDHPAARPHDRTLQGKGTQVDPWWHPSWWCVDFGMEQAPHKHASTPASVGGEGWEPVPVVLQGSPGTVQLTNGSFIRLHTRTFGSLPLVKFLPRVSDADLPGVYASAGAFVLPSRGEGWGRPHVEAMAMGLPVIATNWSGPTAYMREDNSVPLPISGLAPVPDGPFVGHRMGEPSTVHLRHLMRKVWSEPHTASALGAAGRDTMVGNFSTQAVGRLLADELERVQLAAEGQFVV